MLKSMDVSNQINTCQHYILVNHTLSEDITKRAWSAWRYFLSIASGIVSKLN